MQRGMQRWRASARAAKYMRAAAACRPRHGGVPGMAGSLGPAVLAGAAALHHDIVQLLAVHDDWEEVDLALWLGLGLLHHAWAGRKAGRQAKRREFPAADARSLLNGTMTDSQAVPCSHKRAGCTGGEAAPAPAARGATSSCAPGIRPDT